MSNRAKLLIAFVVGAVVGTWVRGQVQIDRCLDAGGRWSEARGICEGPVEILDEP